MKKSFLTFLLITCFACSDSDFGIRANPSVDTGSATDINTDGATLNGEFLALGSVGILDYGFVFSTSTDLNLLSSDFISLGNSPGAGKFSARITNSLEADKEYYFKSYAVVDKKLTVYGQQQQFTSKGSKPSVITEVSALGGFPEDTITIKASNLSLSGKNKISIGSLIAPIIEAKEGTFTCIVPALRPGDYEISVIVGNLKFPFTEKFTSIESTLTSFSPEFVNVGDTVTLTGTNFPSMRRSLNVLILGKEAKIVKSTPTHLKVIVPNATKSESFVTLIVGAAVITSEATIKLIED